MDDTGDSFGLTIDDFINLPPDEELASDADGRGADDRGSEPVLHEMAREGKIDVLKEALELGGDLTEENEEGDVPLEAAAAGGSAEAIELLLSSGADPTRRDDEGGWALFLAAQAGAPGAVKCLLDAGVEATTFQKAPPGSTGDTVLTN